MLGYGEKTVLQLSRQNERKRENMRADELVVKMYEEVKKENEELKAKIKEYETPKASDTPISASEPKRIYEYSYPNKAYVLYYCNIASRYDLKDIKNNLLYRNKSYDTREERIKLLESLLSFSDEQLIKANNSFGLKNYCGYSKLMEDSKSYFGIKYETPKGNVYADTDSLTIINANGSGTYFETYEDSHANALKKAREYLGEAIKYLKDQQNDK